MLLKFLLLLPVFVFYPQDTPLPNTSPRCTNTQHISLFLFAALGGTVKENSSFYTLTTCKQKRMFFYPQKLWITLCITYKNRPDELGIVDVYPEWSEIKLPIKHNKNSELRYKHSVFANILSAPVKKQAA